ncbi:FxSxx-COOH system tetratricopeptide repeat protein, partial [Streptomyces sp. SBT349]|uniref:FxSxx-COOH system tetratricopeptide repeat protein n=1 Tax=Streptomyces sp. SBT349 TaxID=1580539 RepID=UPI00066BD443
PGDHDLRHSPRYPLDRPRIWGGVPRRNIRFTGREETLQRVYDQLQNAEPGAAVVTLLGLSGVGKTQIGAEYVYRFGSEYDVVWWVPADQRGTLRQRLAELAPALGLVTGPGYGERLRAVAAALRRGEPHARWLVVMDGADDPGPIADLLPAGPGHVVITSQNRGWAEYNTAVHEVQVYSREESVAFMRRRAPRLGAEEADRLADALGDLPLALDQTAGWLNDSAIPVDDYIVLLAGGPGLTTGPASGLRVADDYPRTYFSAFSMLLDQLRETVPLAVDLLRLCAHFAPGAIPVELVRGIPDSEMPDELRAVMSDAWSWSTAIGKLVQYSVIRWEEGPERSLSRMGGHIHLHPLVHLTVRYGLGGNERRVFSRAARRALTAANPGRPSDPGRWPRFARIVPHLDASGALTSGDADTHRLILHCLSYLNHAGEYTTGAQLAERATRAWRRTFGEDDPRVWDLMSQLATLRRATGAYAESERVDRTVIERLGALRGPRDLTVLRAEEGLSADLCGLAQYGESLRVIRGVLDSYLEQVGERHTRTLNARHNLAASLRLLGRCAEALATDLRNLAARTELHGERDGLTLTSANAVALDLRLLGRYREALTVLGPTVGDHRDVLGPDHPQTLTAELNRAMCLLGAGDAPEAHGLLAALLERAERVTGDSAPLTLTIATCYASVHRDHGDLDQARAVGERAMNHYALMLGAAHPFAVGTAANHALLLRVAGEWAESSALNESCLRDMGRALGPDHPWTLGIALNAAVARSMDGDVAGAAALGRDTRVRADAALGPAHPLSLSVRVVLAADLRALGEDGEAEAVEREALTGLTATFGEEHPLPAAARLRLRPSWDFEPPVL